jgi:CHAT domain-containing protein
MPASAASLVVANQSPEARELVSHAPIERELKGGEAHTYTITLAAGSYLRLVIAPKDIELRTKLFAPVGLEEVGVTTIPDGIGLRSIALVAESSGSYRLEIRPMENEAKAGRYEVKIEELRSATEPDRVRVAAEKATNEGFLLASSASTAEQKRQGIAKYDEALALWRQIGDRNGELRVLVRLNVSSRLIGELRTALDYNQQAIQIAQVMGDRYQEANMTVVRGLLHRSLGENQKALDAFNQARQLFKSLAKNYGEATAVYNIGLTLMYLGQWQDALPYFDEALPTFSTSGDHGAECHLLNSIGLIYRHLGDMQRAIEFYNRALAITRTHNFRNTEAYSLLNLGDANLELGDPQKALEFYEQAVKLSRAYGSAVSAGDALKAIGEAADLLGDHQKALDTLKQALELFRANWERDREAKALFSLARINTALGNLNEARKQIELALEIQESLRAKVISQELRDAIFTSAQSSFALYIDLLMRLHKNDPTAGHEIAALEASERARARSLLELLSESQADIRQGVAKNLLELERSLQQQINAKAAARAALLSDKRTQVQAASFDKEIAELTLRYREVEVRIRQGSPHYAALTQPQPLTATEIQQQLDDHTVLLEFALGEKGSWLWAVTRTAINSYPLPASARLESSARKVYELLTARQPKRGESETQYQTRIADADRRFRAESLALSQLLLGPIATRLQQDWKGKRLAIVASGGLEYIPFSALPVPEVSSQPGASNQDSPRSTGPHLPLIAQHEIINLPSVSVLALIRRETAGRKAAEKTVAVIADPVFELNDPRVLNAIKKTSENRTVANFHSGNEAQTSAPESASANLNSELLRALRGFDVLNERGGFSRLPFSHEEANTIVALTTRSSSLKATDFQANRAIATGGELSDYRIIHFATHGLLNSQHPELSGLVLSLLDETGKAQDGFLRMPEIYNLHLPADLIVLSACQTALGKQLRGEGLVGLTRGFMYAGAQRVVASLWQVDDYATAQLMKGFYRGMLKEGLRPAAALRLAQLEMRKQERWASPFFWAAFTIQGEWK